MTPTTEDTIQPAEATTDQIAETKTDVDLTALRDTFSGDLHAPGDPGWDEARAAWNLAVDQHPAAVAIPADSGDVARAVRFARDNGLKVSVQGTGHNAAAYDGSIGESLMIRTDRLREVAIEPATQTARVGAGVTWGEVVGPAAEHGLAPLAGSSHDVGVVGYTLGGGVSWLARKHGLAAEQVTAFEIVSAHGDPREVTAVTDPELFWALRGGGGNFAVITAMEFKLLPITEVYAGALFFPYERAGEVLEAWRRWTATVPDEVTSIGRMIQMPPLPGGAGLPPRPVVRRHRGDVHRLRGTGRRAARPAARARPGHGHVRDHRDSGPARPAHGPARAGAGARRPPDARRPRRRFAGVPRRGGRPGLRLAAALVRVPPPRRRARQAGGGQRRARRPERQVHDVRGRDAPGARDGGAAAQLLRGGAAGSGGARQRRQLHELRRASGRAGGDLRRALAEPPPRDPGQRRPRGLFHANHPIGV